MVMVLWCDGSQVFCAGQRIVREAVCCGWVVHLCWLLGCKPNPPAGYRAVLLCGVLVSLRKSTCWQLGTRPFLVYGTVIGRYRNWIGTALTAVTSCAKHGG